MLHPENEGQPLPLIMTGPESSADYFRKIDEFIAATLGDAVRKRYEIVIDDPRKVAQRMLAGLDDVLAFRKKHGDAYYFNWRLTVAPDFQRPFVATHESMASLNLNEDLPRHVLAANLRRAFSGIVSGNVREDTAAMIERDGPFEIEGSRRIMNLLDGLLSDFVAQKRMKISTGDYEPCYVIK